MEHKTKIILDRELKTDLNSNIYKNGKIYVFYSNQKILNQVQNDNITYIPTPVTENRLNIKFILEKLYTLGIMSILVESGGILNGSFLPYIDKLYHFTAPKILGDNNGKSCFGGKCIDKISDCVNLVYEKTEFYEPDILNIYNKSV